MASLIWPVERSLLPDVTVEQRVLLEEAIVAAQITLWRLTGAQYGLREVVARPCPGVQDTVDDYRLGGAGHGFTPVLDDGKWFNVPCGGGCQADGPWSAYLPGPVWAVVKVEVDGVKIDRTSYALEGNRLIRAGGRSWPTQNLARPLGEPGTWGVTYLQGVPAPDGAGARVAMLALEFYKAQTGDAKCRLPRNWQSVSRQGINVQRQDARELAELGLTGLPEIDTWLRAVNPNGVTGPSEVASPDMVGGK